MLFHTWAFVLFFLIAYPMYLALKGTRFRLHWLLAVSYFFYACFNPLYLILIAYSTILDYTVVSVMEKYGRRKVWLSISVVNNLFLLSLFKYAGFITDNLNVLLSSFNVPYTIPAPGLPFPVGISFYIFQSMSYTIDYYRGNMERERSLIRYATFVSLFPRLLAGPIERAKNLLPQLHKKATVSMQDFS
ncbi:MAG: MBOAT family O-acyltransferase, partial [Planctomycetota bacterium]